MSNKYCIIFAFFFFWGGALQPPVGQGLLIHEVHRSHITTHHSRKDSSGRVISSSRRPPDNTQLSQYTNINAPSGTRTNNTSGRAAADLRIRPRGHWDRFSPVARIKEDATCIFVACDSRENEDEREIAREKVRVVREDWVCYSITTRIYSWLWILKCS
jgi:hypothetical protein